MYERKFKAVDQILADGWPAETNIAEIADPLLTLYLEEAEWPRIRKLLNML